MQPGIYATLTNEAYHRGAGVSKSQLDLVRRSPQHFKAAMDRPELREPTEAMEWGTALHTRVLEPERFNDLYVVFDDSEIIQKIIAEKPDTKVARATKAYKDAKAAFDAEHAGKAVLDRNTAYEITQAAASIGAHPVARAIFTSGVSTIENSFFWTDEKTGELCRCRPDFLRDDGIMVDLKTAEDASEAAFSRSVANYRYHVQDAYYRDGIAANAREVRAVIFIVVEKKFPFAVACYSLDSASVELGRAEYRADLDLFSECKKGDKWPGYGDTIKALSLPAWYAKRAELSAA